MNKAIIKNLQSYIILYFPLAKNLTNESDAVARANQEIKFLEEFKLSKEEVVLAKKLAEDWIIKNWK